VELALNIAWLAVAAVLLLLCGARALSFTERRKRITALVALACLIWLLFPVISITDDLNASQSVYEGTTTKKSKFNEIATALLTAIGLITFEPQVAWREINLHADSSDIQQEFFTFDLLRRPPPTRH
jgi:purine-cytosine permease-like protein